MCKTRMKGIINRDVGSNDSYISCKCTNSIKSTIVQIATYSFSRDFYFPLFCNKISVCFFILFLSCNFIFSNIFFIDDTKMREHKNKIYHTLKTEIKISAGITTIVFISLFSLKFVLQLSLILNHSLHVKQECIPFLLFVLAPYICYVLFVN